MIPTAFANAGLAQYVPTGVVVTLDGSASTADFGKTLTYAWTLTSRPAGSAAALSDYTSALPTFAADVPGTYVASLVVNDGKAKSFSSTVQIVVGPVVTTFAGSTFGFLDGVGNQAKFGGPGGIVVDSDGNLYVTDNVNFAIRKITPTGVVSTLAGGTQGFANGTGSAARFYSPSGVTVDVSGNVYVADIDNNAIRKISPVGLVTTLAGNGTAGFANGTGTSATFSYPRGVAVDVSGNVYVADSGNFAIRKITPTGVVTTLAGGTQGFTNGTGSAASFRTNWGSQMAVDASGNVYVTDSGNFAIRKISPVGLVTTLAGNGTAGFANGTGTAASFGFYFGGQIAVDVSGNVYVADSGNNAIRKISPAGVVTTLAGDGTAGFANGTGKSATFYSPYGVAVDVSGNVYVADTGNFVIRKISKITP